MRSRLVLFAVFLLNPFLASDLWAGSSAISRKLDKVAASLTKDYRAKHPEKTGVSLAVFSLSSSRALARRGVGFAVSELLMRQFVKSPTFVIVERSALNKVLEEQKLQLTGVIDSATAVRVGKIIGAEVLLLGNVEKLGSNYHVTARLVDAQSGEVVSVGYEELSAGLFEDEAQPFLASVPKRQAIGFYFLYNYRHSRNNVAASTFNDQLYNGSGTLNPKSFGLSLGGLGIRYFPKQAMVVDVSGAIFISDPVVADHTILPGNSAFAGLSSGKAEISSGYSIRATSAWVHDLTFRSRTYLGGGIAIYRVASNSAIESFVSVTPTLKAGYEFKVQERLALAVFINYDVLSANGKSSIALGGADVVQLGKLSFEPQVALYF